MTLDQLRKTFESQGPDDDMERLKQEVCIAIFKIMVVVM